MVLYGIYLITDLFRKVMVLHKKDPDKICRGLFLLE